MAVHTMRVRRLGIDTHQQAVVYMRQDCPVCRSEGFAAEARVALAHGERAIVATLNTRPVVAAHAGRVVRIDNRRLARAAKLAGAPGDRRRGSRCTRRSAPRSQRATRSSRCTPTRRASSRTRSTS